MKEQTKIPISKIKRTGKFVAAGVKVGGNYLKHYAKKATGQESTQEDLDEANAEDIYSMLSELKGGALKAAQMLSMDQGVLPKAFREKFQAAQYSAPPLSYPLVVKTFQKHFDKKPTELFDTFSKQAVNAASIGQVHQATKDGKKLAVKVQYPGVADSMSNDLKMAAPLAARLMKVKLWDFYQFQVHDLKQVHADPHPGNFIVTPDDQLGIIDFGCVKEIPLDFYGKYFQVIEPENIKDPSRMIDIFDELDFLLASDTEEQRTFFINVLSNAISLLGRPFLVDRFDFGDKAFFEEINTMMLGLATDKELRNLGGARGSRHAIYVNRVYFGLYNILAEIGAEIDIKKP